jgi:histidinol-phosphate/aromatic aminotransferase/cobyric acid decarboxylase-like protein
MTGGGTHLAIDSYRDVRSLADETDVLNLSWTLDERKVLAVDLQARLLQWLSEDGLEHVNRYLVSDPYGEKILAGPLRQFFATAEAQWRITCGAGVNSLLHALAPLCRAAPVHVLGQTYPDFPCWIERNGGVCIGHGRGESPQSQSAAFERQGLSLVFLERPAFASTDFDDLGTIRELCARAARLRGLVLIDESNANYCPPAFSAVHLLDCVDNLIVLRGFSKAYGLGGLRLGVCLASMSLESTIRSITPPLQASSLSLYLGSRLLELGDIARTLRAKISEHKRVTQRVMENFLAGHVTLPNPFLPYILLTHSQQELHETLARRGVLGKRHPVWSADAEGPGIFYRYSVPLDPQRMDLLESKLAVTGPV